MNIISNNCIGGRLYQLNNIQYDSPFFWTLINIDDFIKLVINHKNINFENINILLEQNNHLKNKSILINIDNLIDIHYIHYIYDENYDNPGIKKGAQNKDIFYKDIINYSKEKYFNRLKRFNKYSNFEYIFSFNYSYLKLSNEEYYEQFIKIINLSKLGYKILLIMNNNCNFKNDAINYESNNLHICWLSPYECTASRKEHYEKIYKEYKNFFNK